MTAAIPMTGGNRMKFAIVITLLLLWGDGDGDGGIFAYVISPSRRGTCGSRRILFQTPKTVLAAASEIPSGEDGSKKEDEEDLKRRMAVVRSLQMSFYSSSNKIESNSNSNSTSTSTSTSEEGKEDERNNPALSKRTSLDKETGQLLQLPLWRVPWVEVPGRSNVLHVHEPIYTNMFETILYGPKPWTFGHLYLKGGSQNLKSDQGSMYQLETWESSKTGVSRTKSAVLGCLMNISDYRRLADGRLVLLIHAMERFVVTDIKQKLPYGIVNAQILPDAEEMGILNPTLLGTTSLNEKYVQPARATAVQESLRFHDYEYDPNHVLPVPDGPDLDVSDIFGSAIAKVLPYCPYSKSLEPPASSIADRPPLGEQAIDTTDTDSSSSQSSSTSLEYRLLRQGILQTPLSDPEFETTTQRRQSLTTDELEQELWLAINNFLIATRTPVSPVLLGLLPHFDHNNDNTGDAGNLTWPTKEQGFILASVVEELEGTSENSDSADYDFVRISSDYPAHRRQRRLSYTAAHLMESSAKLANAVLRPQLLATPSTHQRLRLVLGRFDQWQEAKWGEFQ